MVQELTEGLIAAKLAELLESGRLDAGTEKLVRLRYGIGTDHPLTVPEIAKALKRPQKRVKQELETAERRVFNLIKDQV